MLTLALSIVTSVVGCGSGSTFSSAPILSKLVAENSSSSGGNGQFYGGKPDNGLYIRPLPDLKCGALKNLGELLVSDNGVEGTFVDPTSCAVSRSYVPASALEFVAYEKGRLGHIEGIYSRSSQAAKGAIEEAWCRKEGSTITTGYDVIVQADYNKRSFEMKVVSARIGSDGEIIRREYPSLRADRRVEGTERVRYKTDKFEIDIRTRSFDAKSGTMLAEFEAEIEGYETETKINCRLGGELDVKGFNRPFETAQLLQPSFYKNLALTYLIPWLKRS